MERMEDGINWEEVKEIKKVNLLDNAVADLLGNLNTDSTVCDVPDSASATVIELVGHTTVNGWVNFDVNIVTNLVGVHVGGEGS